MWGNGDVAMKQKRQITLRGESVVIVDRLCELTGLTPRHLVALLLRKYGKELESWVGSPGVSSSSRSETPEPKKYDEGLESWVGSPVASSSSRRQTPEPAPAPAPTLSTKDYYAEPTLEMPKDPGTGLKPIEL